MKKDKKENLTSVAMDWTPPSESFEIVTPEEDMVPVPELAPPVAMNPRYLNDFVVDYNPDTVTKIAWMSEEGTRRVEIPSWLYDKFRK